MSAKFLQLSRVYIDLQLLRCSKMERNNILIYITRYIIMNNLEIDTIDISFNDLTCSLLRDMKVLLEVLPNIKNISLQNNKIETLESIEYALQTSRNTLEQILIQGNPFAVANSSSELQLLHSHISTAFPNIQKIDNQPVQRLISFALPPKLSTQASLPPAAGSCIAPNTDHVIELVSRFITLYDAKDNQTINLYSPQGLFSLSFVTTLPLVSSSTSSYSNQNYYQNQNQPQPPQNEAHDEGNNAIYHQLSQNLIKVTTNTSSRNPRYSHQKKNLQQSNALVHTQAEIPLLLKKLPRTRHLPNTFVFDVLILQDTYQVTVSGSLLEWSSNTKQENIFLRDFSRTLLISSTGLILHDMLTFPSKSQKVQPEEIQALVYGTQSHDQDPAYAAASQSPEAMLQYICMKEHISPDVGKQVLMYAQYNLDRALQIIAEQRSLGKI